SSGPPDVSSTRHAASAHWLRAGASCLQVLGLRLGFSQRRREDRRRRSGLGPGSATSWGATHMQYRHLLLAAATLALATSANAQDKKFNIKLSYWVTPAHLLKPVYKEWGESVQKASNGSITVTLFPSSQLGSGPDHYDMVKRGVPDMGLINPGHTTGRLPVHRAQTL